MRKDTEEIFGQRQVDVIHSAYIIHTLYQQQKLGKYCDLKVLVGDKQYFVHRCILAAASVQLDSQINGLDTIQLVGVTYYGFECLLEILYSGKLKDISMLSDSKFQQIVSAADALNAQIVMDYCTRERSDLMQLLLSQSDSVNATSENENEKLNNNLSVDLANGESVASLEDGIRKNCDQAEISSKEIKVESRPFLSADFGYGEAPVAAEVEVGSPHKQEDKRTMEGGGSGSQDQLPPIQQNVGDATSCTVCGVLFQSSADLAMHMRVHIVDPLFRCDVCGLHFKLESALIRHKLSHCTCQFCGLELKSVHEVQLHVRERHPDHVLAAQITSEAQAAPPPKQNRGPKKRSGVTPSMARNKLGGGKPAINPVVVNEIMRGEDGKYQCPLCDRGFDRRWNLKCHVLIHTAPKEDKVKETRYADALFTCPECGKMFRNLHNLRRHASSMHGMSATDLEEAGEGNHPDGVPKKQRKDVVEPDASDEYKFWCNVCGRGFKRNRNLRGHMESHQTQNEAKYECPVCHRKFAQKESLNGHLWVHRGDKSSKGDGDAKPDFV